MKTFTIAKPISISIDNFYIQVLPFILFFISIFFDSANGYIQEFKGVHLPIGIAFRGFILCLTMKFLLKNLSTLLTLLFWIIRLCKLNCVMLYSHSISSVGERPAPRGGTTRPDERKITII